MQRNAALRAPAGGGRQETIVPTEPPAPRAPAVIARLRIAERELADLKLQIDERLLAVAEGKLGAKESWAALCQKITVLTLEIESSPKARVLAARLDQEALADYRADIQKLSPEEIIAGISKEQCCRRCTGAGRCVISDGSCGHPLLQSGSNARYSENSQVRAVYAAACEKLNVRLKA
jgi:hypothetical protein